MSEEKQGDQFTPTFEVAEDGTSVTFHRAEGEDETVPMERAVSQFNKGAGYDAQADDLGKLRTSSEASDKELGDYKDMFADAYEKVTHAEDPEAELKKLMAGLETKPPEPPAVADGEEWNTELFGPKPTAPEPGLTGDEVEKRVEKAIGDALYQRDIRQELDAAIKEHKIPDIKLNDNLTVRDAVKNIALQMGVGNEIPHSELVGQVWTKWTEGVEAVKQAEAERVKAAQAVEGSNISELGHATISSADGDPRLKPGMMESDPEAFKAALLEHYEKLSGQSAGSA